MLVRNFLASSAVLLAALGFASVSQAGNGCGCGGAPQAGYCCPPVTVVCGRHFGKHHCHHGCMAMPPPSGPIVESMAAPRFAAPMSTVPLMVAADYAVMPTMRAVSVVQAAPQFVTQAAPQYVQAAPQCSSSQAAAQAQAQADSVSGRVTELEQRMETLRSRVNVLQTSIDNQTELLEAIAERLEKKG